MTKLTDVASLKLICFILLQFLFAKDAMAQIENNFIAKKSLPQSRLELSRRSQAGSFYDVVGRKSAAFGYEHRGMEAWVYPLKLVDDFKLNFKIEGYNLGFRQEDLLTHISARPEATVFTYTHAAFTVRQIVFAPVDEQGLIMLLDISTTLPMTLEVQFRPKLKLMWAGNLMTNFVGQDEKQKFYFIGEESQKFYGIVGTPGAKDVSLQPYQEEPQDVPVRYLVEISPQQARQNFVPIVFAGSVEGRKKAEAVYASLLTDALTLYTKNVEYYDQLQSDTTQITTPDERLNTAFAWAKVGVEKGIATNPYLGTGLLAGFRTSGDSERPGFAWFFGRDALWTALATNSYGDFATTRLALDFLQKFQREDGKIPHEISQSATLIDWWKSYPYAWAAADAPPLYVIVNADLYRASGDKEFLRKHWDAIKKAYKFSQATDTDGNGLLENTKFGHGWVEGGALYPPHEEIYLQGVWIEASRNLAEMAEALGDKPLAAEARQNAARTSAAMEQTFWLEDKEFYAYATKLPTKDAPKAEPGPNKIARQARLEELKTAKIFDEDTVLPAVPLFWRTMPDERAQKQIDRLGSHKIATDWGARILANDSRLYDPLSYHNGSVWALFTGWSSLAAYNYGRPHVGQQALTANALLTFTNALGYVTELISGDFNTAFGRSSHHQVWSEAMVVTPVMRGMLGIEIADAGKTVRFAPKIPANWNDLEARGVRAGNSLIDFKLARKSGNLIVSVGKRAAENKTENSVRLVFSPTFPLDANVKTVTINNKKVDFTIKKIGDVQQAEIQANLNQPQTQISIDYDEGSDVYIVTPDLIAGAESSGLRVIKSRADQTGLSLTLEGVCGKTYLLNVKSPNQLQPNQNVSIESAATGEAQLKVTFQDSPQRYAKLETRILFQNKSR